MEENVETLGRHPSVTPEAGAAVVRCRPGEGNSTLSNPGRPHGNGVSPRLTFATAFETG